MDSKDRLQSVEIDGGHRRDMLNNRGGGCSPSKVVREDSLSVSWNPSWLGSGVSPPSFGADAAGVSGGGAIPVTGRGRGRANVLASLLAATTPAVGRHPSTDVKSDSGDDSSSAEEDEMLIKLQEHQREWSREMESMQERGRELDKAMQALMSRRTSRKHKQRHGRNPAGTGFHPVLSSTCAYGMGAANKTVSLESGDGGSLSSTQEVGVGCRPPVVKRDDSQTLLDTQLAPSRVQSLYAPSAVHPPVLSSSGDRAAPSGVQPQSVPPVVQYQSVPTAMPNQHSQSQYVPQPSHDRHNTSQMAASSSSHGAHVPLHPAPVAQSFLPSSSGGFVHAPAAVSHQFLSPVVSGSPASYVPAVPAADVSNVSLGDLRSVMRRDLRFKSFGKE